MLTQNASSQSATTPARALELLLEGNARFRAGEQVERDLLQQVADTRGGQWPFAAVLSCIDSRVPVEVVFDQGIGDVFSARVAGNGVNEDVLGSLEYACRVAGSKLVLVLGHSHCGAIKGACDGVELGHVTALLAKLRPAVEGTTEPVDPGARSSGNLEFVQAVVSLNVRHSVAAILARSEVLRAMQDAGEIEVVGALYDVESGRVELVGPDAD